MADNKIKIELSNLISMGTKILHVGVYEIGEQEFDAELEKYLKKLSKEVKNFKKKYHVWYPRAYRCIRSLSPERLEEFEEFYKGKKNIKSLDYLSAGITHFLQGIVTTRGMDKQNYSGKFSSGLQEQINILEGIYENIDEVLFNLESEIHYGIFKSEIDVANELKKHKQLRAAGAVVGVVIEKHLKLACSNNNSRFRKKTLVYQIIMKRLRKKSLLIWLCGD